MNNEKRFSALLQRWGAWMGVAALLIATGCGSGTESLSASGGIGGSGVTIGEVSEYGSIFVNGIELDTTQAEIYVEGALAGTGDQTAYSHLPIGQRVVVQGDTTDDSNGKALRVDAFYYVQGPVWAVESLDNATLGLDVMGQTVFVDPQTTLSGVTLTTLSMDMVIKVSGTVDAQGAVHAGHIALVAEHMAPTQTVAVKGHIQSLSRAKNQFSINDLVVDYSQVQFAPELLTEDGSISIQGTLTDGILSAGSMQPFDIETFDSAENFSMDGFITAPVATGLWRMGPYQIQIDATTWFDGMDPQDLDTGIRVQVQGRLRQRVLEARRVTAVALVVMESHVISVDLPNRTVTLAGMTDIPIRYNILTHVHGDALTIWGIIPGDHVRIFGYYRNDGSVIAVDLYKNFYDLMDYRFLLQGPVTGVAAATFSLMGTTIDPYANEGIGYYKIDGSTLTADALISALNIGSLARIVGRWANDQLVYESMLIKP